MVDEEGSGVFRFIGSQRTLTPALKAIVKNLLKDHKQNYRYCPCCKQYDKACEPSDTQMGDFLEFIRQEHYKTVGGSPSKKPKKNNAMRLSGDSASDITDLSKEGILTSTV